MSYMQSPHSVRVTYIKFIASSYSKTGGAILQPKVKVFFFLGVVESTKTMGTNDPFTSNEIHTHLKTNESPNQYAGDRVLQSDGRGFHRDGQNINNVDQESYFHRNRIKRKLNFSPGQRVFLTVCTFMSKQSYHISTENCGKFKLISS